MKIKKIFGVHPFALEKCGEIISTVCTFGYKGTGRFRESEVNEAEERLQNFKAGG